MLRSMGWRYTHFLNSPPNARKCAPFAFALVSGIPGGMLDCSSRMYAYALDTQAKEVNGTCLRVGFGPSKGRAGLQFLDVCVRSRPSSKGVNGTCLCVGFGPSKGRAGLQFWMYAYALDPQARE
eukprot:1152001-Pelagomonas_calceolata.AAC.3